MALLERLSARMIYASNYKLQLLMGKSVRCHTSVNNKEPFVGHLGVWTPSSACSNLSIDGDSHSCRQMKRHLHSTSQCFGVMEDRDTKALTVWSSIKSVRRSPVPALTLGIAGLIPFISAPAYMMMNQIYMHDMAFAQIAYGAVILSFVGGVRLGFTLPEENPVQPDWINIGYSVMPSLVAWGGLLLPHPLSLLTVMGGLTLSGYFDMAMYGYPPWFKGLRFLLSFVAVLSLWTTFMCGFLLNEKKAANSISKF